MSNESQQNEHGSEYLNAEQASQLMGVTVELVRKLCDEGLLAGARQDHQTGPWRIPATTVEQWRHNFGQTTINAWSAIWGILTFLFGLVFLYFFFHIWYRLASPDPEFLAFSAAVIQILSIVSLLGLGTDWGKHAATSAWQFITHGHDRRDYPRLGGIWVARLAALALLLFMFGLPLVASYANASGLTAFDNGQYSIAIKRFKQAVAAVPTNPNYHYNLGLAYEVITDFEEATAAYRHLLDRESFYWPAYHRLGLIYLVHPKEPDAAIKVFTAGLSQVKHQSVQPQLDDSNRLLIQGLLLNNIGLAYIELGQPKTARRKLDQAQGIFAEYDDRSDKTSDILFYLAETHRLLALTYESIQEPEESLRAWMTVEGYAIAYSASSVCQTESNLTNVYCSLVQEWLQEAAEHTTQ